MILDQPAGSRTAGDDHLGQAETTTWGEREMAMRGQPREPACLRIRINIVVIN